MCRVQVEAVRRVQMEAAAEEQHSAPEQVGQEEPVVPEPVERDELALAGGAPTELQLMGREPTVPERVAQAAAER
jgi:hypothetical protein